MIIPTTHMKRESARPWGRPQVSRIFARGSFDRPPITLDMMVVAAVSECSWKVLVTKGVRTRTTTSAVEVIK